jgi:hypothetical protein
MADNLILKSQITYFKYEGGEKINKQNDPIIDGTSLNIYCSADDLNKIATYINNLSTNINIFNTMFDNQSFSYNENNNTLSVKLDNQTIKKNDNGLFVDIDKSTIIYNSGKIKVNTAKLIDDKTIKANPTSGFLYTNIDDKTIKANPTSGFLYTNIDDKTIKANPTSGFLYTNIDKEWLVYDETNGNITVRDSLKNTPEYFEPTSNNITVYVDQTKGANPKSNEKYTDWLNNSGKPFKTFTAALETLQKCRTSKIITFTITLLSDYVYDMSANSRIKLFHPDCQLGRMYIKYSW